MVYYQYIIKERLIYGTVACENMFENIKRKNYTILFATLIRNMFIRG